MNKVELIDAIAQEASLTKGDAKKFLDAFVEVISTSLIQGEKVTIFKFGTFSKIERKARTGYNPITKTSLEVPAKKIVRFKPSINLNDKVK
jgi:DNA-binding protein HU-beta